MAITESRTLPAEFIEGLGKQYAATLPGIAGQPITTTDISATMAQQPGEKPEDFQARKDAQSLAATQYGERKAGMAALRPQVAGLDALQTEALGKSGGLGSYAPYLAAAGAQAGTAATTLGGVSPYISAAGTGLGTAGTELSAAGTAMTGAIPGYLSTAQGLTGTGAGTGTGSIQSYMSPYQQQVIDASLAKYDEQAAARQSQMDTQLAKYGGLDAGRTGIQRAAYQSESDLNRSALNAQLLQQGYGQAQGARQQDFASQLGLAGAQQQYGSGLAGLAQQRAGLGQAQLGLGQAQTGLAGAQMGQAGFQTQLAGMAPQLAAQEISGLGTLGSVRQAQAQADLDAGTQAASMAAYEPMQRAGFYGSQVTGLMGGYPAQYNFQQQPSPSPLTTAVQAGTGLAGLWGNLALAKALGS